MAVASPHKSLTATYAERAKQASHPLSEYLFRLMTLKASNLCLSADVASARELLHLADRLGPSIVVLKTHYDLVAGWDYNAQSGTGARLACLARKHGFLIFEDRKFADIGRTVQMQYAAGTAHVIDWAHMTTANMDAGKAMVAALAEAAAKWKARINYEVRTSVSVGTPLSENFDDDDVNDVSDAPGARERASPSGAGPGFGPASGSEAPGAPAASHGYHRDPEGRKGSIVSVTTVTQSFEPVDSPRQPKSALDGGGGGGGGLGSDDIVYAGIEEPPSDRGLLLLAQMSTAGCLMTPAYTQACVEAAREHKDFVMGFVAQECLNARPDDNFVHMTPGCKLPPDNDDDDDDEDDEDEDDDHHDDAPRHGRRALEGDGLGQQYNTPSKLIGLCGTDLVIVGRGIISADDPPSEAERYRRHAWQAYLDRVGQ